MNFGQLYREAVAGDAEAQYQVGLIFWEKARNPKEGERWLRYAAHQWHEVALQQLNLGIRVGAFLSEDRHINNSAMALLKLHFPKPTRAQVKAFGHALRQCLEVEKRRDKEARLLQDETQVAQRHRQQGRWHEG